MEVTRGRVNGAPSERFELECRPAFSSCPLRRLLLQLGDPMFHEMAVVVERASAHEVAIDHAGLVDVDAAADFEVELALRHRRHAASADAIGTRGDLDAMADAGAWLAVVEEPARHSQQDLVLTDV